MGHDNKQTNAGAPSDVMPFAEFRDWLDRLWRILRFEFGAVLPGSDQIVEIARNDYQSILSVFLPQNVAAVLGAAVSPDSGLDKLSKEDWAVLKNAAFSMFTSYCNDTLVRWNQTDKQQYKVLFEFYRNNAGKSITEADALAKEPIIDMVLKTAESDPLTKGLLDRYEIRFEERDQVGALSSLLWLWITALPFEGIAAADYQDFVRRLKLGIILLLSEVKRACKAAEKPVDHIKQSVSYATMQLANKNPLSQLNYTPDYEFTYTNGNDLGDSKGMRR